jgi:hypothetical protein
MSALAQKPISQQVSGVSALAQIPMCVLVQKVDSFTTLAQIPMCVLVQKVDSFNAFARDNHAAKLNDPTTNDFIHVH